MESLFFSVGETLKLAKAFYHVPYAFVAIANEDSSWTSVGDGVDLQSPFFSKLVSSRALCVDDHNIGIPILDRDQNLKAVFCIPDHHSRIFCQYEIDFMSTYASQISSILDHSELENLEQQQNEVIVQYSRLATLGQMTSEIVHEINNPMAIIQARLELMLLMAKKGELSQDAAVDSLEKLLVTRERVSRIIDSVRTFSRNGDHDAFEAASLNDLLKDAVDFCADRLSKAKVKLQFEPLKQPVIISCRTVQISQVMVNLVNNAIDATQGLVDRWIKISVEHLDHRVRVIVMDCGNGISAEAQDKIFKPFFTSKPKSQGTGLGLSISKNIIEHHHGKLRYEEMDGHTTFVIELPTI